MSSQFKTSVLFCGIFIHDISIYSWQGFKTVSTKKHVLLQAQCTQSLDLICFLWQNLVSYEKILFSHQAHVSLKLGWCLWSQHHIQFRGYLLFFTRTQKYMRQDTVSRTELRMCLQCYFNDAFHHLILNNHILVPVIISILLTFTCLDGTVTAFLLKLSQLLHYIICRAIFFVLCDLAINLDVFWSNEWALKGLCMSGNPFLQNCISKLICCLDGLSFGCRQQLLPSPCCCQLLPLSLMLSALSSLNRALKQLQLCLLQVNMICYVHACHSLCCWQFCLGYFVHPLGMTNLLQTAR